MNKKDKAAINNNSSNKRLETINNKKTLIRRTKEEIGDMEEYEDTTKYGEFISSYFSWLGLEKQKKNADYMENIKSKGKK